MKFILFILLCNVCFGQKVITKLDIGGRETLVMFYDKSTQIVDTVYLQKYTTYPFKGIALILNDKDELELINAYRPYDIDDNYYQRNSYTYFDSKDNVIKSERLIHFIKGNWNKKYKLWQIKS